MLVANNPHVFTFYIKLTTESNRYLTNCQQHETIKIKRGCFMLHPHDFLISNFLLWFFIAFLNLDCVLITDFLAIFRLHSLVRIFIFIFQNRIFGSRSHVFLTKILMQFLLNECKKP